MRTVFKLISLLLIFFISDLSFGQIKHDFLQRVWDTIIPFGKYLICFTDKFDKFAIVSAPDKGIIGIDRKENILFNVYVFDNGPDYPSNGLFRIIKDGKIGYADMNGNPNNTTAI